MKIDPYNHEQQYRDWQEAVKNGIPGLSKVNSDLIIRYVNDMEHGISPRQGGAIAT